MRPKSKGQCKHFRIPACESIRHARTDDAQVKLRHIESLSSVRHNLHGDAGKDVDRGASRFNSKARAIATE
jgi:hypothetical protein